MKPKPSALAIFAGKRALAILRDEGLRPDRVKVVAGAAGGPKGLVLNGLDHFLIDFFAQRKQPLFLLGASIGAWRFLAATLGPASLERFSNAYIDQSYLRPPAPEEVSAQSRYILKQLLGKNPPADALAHPFYRLGILAVRGRHLVGSVRKPVLGLGLGGAAAANLVKRKLLKFFFERTLFYDRRDIPPFFGMSDLPSQKVALSAENLVPAAMASGAIPLLMAGVRDIPGAAPGCYWDGGIVDYHIDIDHLGGDSDALVLFPHFSDRVIPGWLDKALTWRTPSSASRDNLVLLAPSRDFVQTLPYGKIPDRSDFKRFFRRDGQRTTYWRQAMAAGARLAEDFSRALDSGRIGEWARPLPW
jgi:hypothetical protein